MVIQEVVHTLYTRVPQEESPQVYHRKNLFSRKKYRVWNKCVPLELKQNHPPNMMYLVDGWNRQENRATKTELHYRINLIQKLSRTDMTDSTEKQNIKGVILHTL